MLPADVVFQHPKTGKGVMLNFPMYRPHELAHVFLGVFQEQLYEVDGLDQSGQVQKTRMEKELNITNAIAMGLWSDSTRGLLHVIS